MKVKQIKKKMRLKAKWHTKSDIASMDVMERQKQMIVDGMKKSDDQSDFALFGHCWKCKVNFGIGKAKMMILHEIWNIFDHHQGPAYNEEVKVKRWYCPKCNQEFTGLMSEISRGAKFEFSEDISIKIPFTNKL